MKTPLPMDTRERILRAVRARTGISGAAIAAALGISRQAAHRHLIALLEQGRLVRSGRTRGVQYAMPGRSRTGESLPGPFHRTYPTRGLAEDTVFAEATLRLRLRSALSRAAYRICAYAFTEMLNNAIEHSHAPGCRVEMSLRPRDVQISIRDRGVGAFESIRKKFRLSEEADAVGELLKGKATSMPARHSGEGIFFTSKICDTFALRSHRIEVAFDARTRDTVVALRPRIEGTRVEMTISRSSRRKLEEIFAEFAPEEYDLHFEKSLVAVRFSARDYVARSEAKRLVFRLEQFREIALDFSGVTSIGQGFADEIFRVFARAHPGVILKRVNVPPAIDAVIRHVIDNQKDIHR
jgi:anti-sigma regulatory factor (Ser/Thr protein kinase)/biotin operon repressor